MKEIEPMATTQNNELESFRDMVKLFIEIDSPATINNNNCNHAKIILEELFRNAKNTAYVYCGHISDEVWGGTAIAMSIVDALNRGVNVQFIVQHPDAIPESSAVAQILKAQNRIHSSTKFSGIGSHFAVFDGKRYRLEKDDSAKSATVCMNNVVNASKLREIAEMMILAA